MLIQLPIILAIYKVVTHPLEYVVKLKDTTVAALTAETSPFYEMIKGENGTIKLVNLIKDKGIAFFQQNNFDADVVADIEANFTKLPDFSVLGLNLGDTPSIKFNAPDFNWLLLIIPVLTFVVYFASMKISRKLTYQPTTAQDQAAGCSNKIMDFIMPMFSLFITFSVPAAVGVYWIFKSIIGTVKQFVLQKAMPLPQFTEEDYKAAEKELKGKAPAPEREMPKEAVKSLCHEDDDDEEPYPTFVGVRGGRYDDDGPDDASAKDAKDAKDANDGVKEAEDGNLMSEKLDAAPLKDDSDKGKRKDKKSKK